MNFCNLDFDIVSDFDIRISSLCYINSTKDYVRNYKRFMQNKPNFQKAKMNVNSLITTDYENKWQRKVRKNKPNSNPIKACPERSRMGQFLQRPKSPAKKSGHTPAYTVRQLFDIVVLYKYHLPIINPFTPLLGQPNENHP